MNACTLSSNMRADYSTGVTKLAQFADYLVINISSPNTPGAWVACRLCQTLAMLLCRLAAYCLCPCCVWWLP